MWGWLNMMCFFQYLMLYFARKHLLMHKRKFIKLKHSYCILSVCKPYLYI